MGFLLQLLLLAFAEEDKVSLVDIVRQNRKNIVQLLQNFLDDRKTKHETHMLSFLRDYDCHRMAKDVSPVSESALEIRGGDTAVCDDEPFSGMALQVYDVDNCDARLTNHVDDDRLVTTYELLDPLILRLGTIPKHASDYAYTPAVSSVGGDLDFKEPISQMTVKIKPSNWWMWWFVFMGGGGYNDQSHSSSSSYEAMGDYAFAGGSHGEVWRGRRRCRHSANNCDDDRKPLILKRLKVEHGMDLLEAGLREIYFGNVLNRVSRSSRLFTTYVDHFFRRVPGQSTLELWIVFQDAGASLRSYLYQPVTSEGGFVVLMHSPFWRKLRMAATNRTIIPEANRNNEDSAVALGRHFPNGQRPQRKVDYTVGRKLLREVLRQILEAAARLADNGIVHRDIKPSNVMCQMDGKLEDIFEAVDADVTKIRCVLGDFSSAWDQFSDQNLYSKGPSKDEQTQEYAPPEALTWQSWIPFHAEKPESYDSWSIGVLALELLLGTPNVFSVDQRTTTLLTIKMTKHGASHEDIQRALYLAALSQFCIFVPERASNGDSTIWPMRHGDPLHKTSMVRQKCTIQDFHQALRARDPLGIGFDSSADPLLHLIWNLLAWDPIERISPSEALRHPFFTILDLKEHALKPTTDNALESLMLDPRMDIRSTDTVDTFTCPKCGREFHDWQSCHSHANVRRHAKFCTYDRDQLPSCLNAHTLLPEHPFSGYCDIQGRRRTIEDFHAVQLHPDHHFYGVFDGHTGNLAPKFAASMFYAMLQQRFANISAESKYVATWKDDAALKMTGIFEEIHEKFLEAVSLHSIGVMDQSGTTATIIYMNDHIVLIASVGDSRAIMSSKDDNGNAAFVQLTENHVAANTKERDLVIQRGGSVSKSSGGTDRVNGKLVITRSIGDANLADYLSREPSVVAMTRSEMKESCGLDRCFVVLASDGLWDVMSNQEVVDMVNEVLKAFDMTTDSISWEDGGAFQEAAERLTQEAYVRGSTDNIGVCVVSVDAS